MIPLLAQALSNSNIAQQISQFMFTVYDRFLVILKAPAAFPDMIWILTPLILTLLLMELYFGRYIEEELGWNTAFGNSLVLIFVSIDLIRTLYYQNNNNIVIDLEFAIVLAVILEGLLLTLIDYFHLLPKKVAFDISSKFPTNFIAYIAVILVYTDSYYLPLDRTTLYAFIFTLLVFLSGITIIHAIVPKVKSQFQVPSAPLPSTKTK